MASQLSVTERAQMQIKAMESPWNMVTSGLIYTLDETDLLKPIKLFPQNKWIKLTIEAWLDHKLLAVPKSRRMMITWTMALCHLWLAMFNEGANVFFISDKEEKSDALVKRAEFIFDHIPTDKILLPKKRSKFCLLEFPGLNASIRGVPQGASQLRQYTATAILADEMAFWEKAQETFAASKPTIDGGGRFTCVSSAQEGFFYDLVFDEIY